MASFQYRAVDASGAIVAGIAEAADTRDLVARLRAEGRMPLKIAPAARGGRLWQALNRDLTPRGGIKPRDRVAFTESLSVLLDAGVSLDRALSILSELAERGPVRAVAERLRERVRGGASLSAALEEESAGFPPIYRGMVRSGEAGATLGPVLARLATTESAAARRRAALVSALIYPAILLVASCGAIGVLLAVVVPSFAPMLQDAGVTPPLSTRIVLAAAETASRGWPAILAAVALTVLALRMTLARPGPRLAWHRLLLRLPVVGVLRRKLGSASLSRLTGEMLRGGVTLPEALGLAASGMSDRAFRMAALESRERVESGQPLAAALRETGAPAPLMLHLTQVGQESGRLSEMLSRTADILDEEAQVTLARLMSLLTPLLTLFMGGLIALIVSSVLFALFSINELAL